MATSVLGLEQLCPIRPPPDTIFTSTRQLSR
jgi:hypothetical protein